MPSLSRHYLLPVAALCLPLSGISCRAESEPSVPPSKAGFYAAAVDRTGQLAKASPTVNGELDRLLAEADAICQRPLVHRLNSLEALRQQTDGRGGRIDGRVNVIEPVSKRKAELFALSMADTITAAAIARELPLLAAAYRLTGKPEYRDTIVRQLGEVVTWDPLQRQGWTIYKPDNDLPVSGRDGVWLSTGLGLVALVQTLQILPPDTLPAELTASIRAQIEREVAQICSDWEKKVPWFVKDHNVVTNQWVVPASGLLVAAAFLGKDSHPEAYALGVTSLQDSLEAFGTDGSTSEGALYASHWTAPFLYLAARAAQETGDSRLADSPFMQKFPDWLAGFYQPGGYVINCFDGYNAVRGAQVTQVEDITLLAVLSQNPDLIWVLCHVFGPDMMALNLYGLMALSIPEDAGRQPPLYAVYERAPWVVWRSSWQEDASGVWIRGGHKLDFHQHNDRGHVNFIVDGKAVLIEAGTPGYDHPKKNSDYGSVKGHNVLQVDEELYPRKLPAALTVTRLDAEGGDVTVDAGAGYGEGSKQWNPRAGEAPASPANAVQWQRRVEWDAHRMVVTDRVTLAKPARVRFRWHLGSEQPAVLAEESPTVATAAVSAGSVTFPGWNFPKGETTVDGVDWKAPKQEIVVTPEISVQVQADQPVALLQERNLDHAFKFRVQNHEHTTLVVQTRDKVSALELRTTLTAK